MGCQHNDCGWCYAPKGSSTNDNNGACNDMNNCPQTTTTVVTGPMTLHKGHTAQDEAMYLRKLQEENKQLRKIAEAASDYKKGFDDRGFANFNGGIKGLLGDLIHAVTEWEFGDE